MPDLVDFGVVPLAATTKSIGLGAAGVVVGVLLLVFHQRVADSGISRNRRLGVGATSYAYGRVVGVLVALVFIVLGALVIAGMFKT